MATPCPPADELARLVAGKLAAPAQAEVQRHVDACTTCTQAIATLAGARTTGLEVTTPAVAGTTGLEVTTAAPLVRTQLSGVVELPDDAAPDALAMTVRHDAAEPATFDRYILDRVLGRGGTGIVYAARDPKLGRDVAIKVLRAELARDAPDLARRVAHEARVMAKISHPNVLGVYDVGTVGDQVYIAMELVAGTNLRGWLDARPRTVAEILEAFVAAGRGLVAAHAAGVVHRDFKPDNVLVGGDGRIRVTDFGLAQAGGGDEAPLGGTPAYMAPEQFAGGTVDGRTDQFAFCVALYEALYGRRPFAGATYDEVANAVTAGNVRPPPPGSRVPPSLRAIVRRGLAVTPGDRFPTLADLLKALGRDRGRRPRQLAIVAAAALAAVGIGFAADWVVRERIRAVTRTAFATTRAYLEKEIELRADSFESQSDALYAKPFLQTIAATQPQADFGLGDVVDDRKFLLDSHTELASATLVSGRAHAGDVLAVADRSGRLLYTSARPDAWDKPITTVPVLAAAYAKPAIPPEVVHASDPRVVATEILDASDRGVYVMFTRVERDKITGVATVGFVRLVPAADLTRDVEVADDPIALAIVAPDGAAQESEAGAFVTRASSSIDEIVADDDTWLVQRAPLVRDSVGALVLARRADVGLAGLFPRARLVLALLAIGLAGVAMSGAMVARRRDLTRR